MGAAKSVPCLPQKVTNHEVSSDEDDVFFDCQDAVLDEPIVQAFSQIEIPRDEITPSTDFTWEANQFTNGKSVEQTTAAFHQLLLQFKECFFNWNLDTHPLSYEEAGLVVTKEIIETAVNPRLIQYLKWRPLGTISQHLTLAFCHFVRMDLTEGERELKILSSLIRTEEVERYLLPDHLEGINYVFHGLSALSQSLLMLKVDDEDRIVEENKLKDYISKLISAGEPDSFSDSAKAAIKFVKSFFMGARQIKDLQLNIVKEISEVETSNVECWTYLKICYRLDRKAVDYKAGPSVDEERTLHHAWKVDKDHVLVKLALVIYLTDMLKAKKFNFRKHGWVVLHEVKTYHNMEEVISDIRDMCRDILEVEGMKDCVRTNVCIADIFMSGLPYNFRDDNMAKQCLEAAIKMNNNCSSASHTLGLLKLKIGCPLDSALVHVRQAFIVDQRNFPALIDTIQLLMSKPSDKKKHDELIELFFKTTALDKWTVKQSASIYVAQGFFLFMIEQTEGAILALTTAC